MPISDRDSDMNKLYIDVASRFSQDIVAFLGNYSSASLSKLLSGVTLIRLYYESFRIFR
jgi:hypothetical protein